MLQVKEVEVDICGAAGVTLADVRGEWTGTQYNNFYKKLYVCCKDFKGTGDYKAAFYVTSPVSLCGPSQRRKYIPERASLRSDLHRGP